MLNSVEQWIFKITQFTPTHLTANSQTIEHINVAAQYLYKILRLTQTHLIASLKITMLKVVEQCILSILRLTPTHLTAISQTIEHILVVVQCI
jgi:hypothetical protein